MGQRDENSSQPEQVTGFAEALGAPIPVGWASPLRVATGGDANWSSSVHRRRSPAHENKRRDYVILFMKTGLRASQTRFDQ
jgi:hypothetical protein